MHRGLLRLWPTCCAVLMGKSKGKTFYAVRVGHRPGIYNSWQECELQVRGFSNARYKGFRTQGEAVDFLNAGGGPCAALHSISGIAKRLRPQQQQKRHDIAAHALQQHAAAAADALAAAQRGLPQVDPADMYRLEFDGGARGNPGPAGAGAVLLHDETGAEVGRVCTALGHTTNNVAEYSGLIAGLTAALAVGVQRLRVLGDSKLVVMQVNGAWQVRNEGLMPLHAHAQHLLGHFEQHSLQHILREHNATADALSNKAMDGHAWEGLRDAAGRTWALAGPVGGAAQEDTSEDSAAAVSPLQVAQQ